MNKYKTKQNILAQQPVFEQYPWADIHNATIAWLANYMDETPETVIKQFDDRILQKVAKDHLILTGHLAFS